MNFCCELHNLKPQNPFILQSYYANMEIRSIIAYMIARLLRPRLSSLLSHIPAVALLGPRQSGKTTLALEIARLQNSVYLDLEDENDRAKLSDPNKYLADHDDQLVILDEVHRAPEIFQQLRGIIDKGRRRGKANGRFLLLDRPQWTYSNSPARVWQDASPIWNLGLSTSSKLAPRRTSWAHRSAG